MKYILVLLLITINSHASYSQTLSTVKNKEIYSGVCVERSVMNFITMCQITKDDFEAQMKSTGAHISYTEKFCVSAAEQIALGSSLNGEHYIFTKCDEGMQILWYGESSASGFKTFMQKLEPYFLEVKGKTRVYGVGVGKANYVFTIERKIENSSQAYETLYIQRVADSK